ncbi:MULTISPECIES: hypothetical protein [Streptomyces]|uniref:hypothetical protein n=1 Tax=Streptomyces TaxID=1883 RepID=UPI001F439945|nr:hypothetical protein [Streptomyces noursei]MCE4943078.1 hypothetical protein [Streptomyces noursei]
MTHPMGTARLLPWTSWDGKPCYLLGGTGTGYVSRLADRVEAEQMASAADLIEDAAGILAARSWTPGEIHLLAVELNTQLTKVHRVSESRGARLVQWEGDLDEEAADDADGGDGDDAPEPAHDSPDRTGPEHGPHGSRKAPSARLATPVRPAGSAPGAPLKGAARIPPAR